MKKILSVCRTLLFILANALSAQSFASGTEPAVYGEELQGFDYPETVQEFRFESQRMPLHMAYMDVKPQQPNGKSVVLLHGKNFCAATWQNTMQALGNAGYRVIVPDQIGFCKSSKPLAYQFSFQQLARNTHALLSSLGIDQTIMIGHSTGGMLGIRYALMYPQEVRQLVLVNPIGLEDWKAKGVPTQSIDQWYARERMTSSDSIRRYEQSAYYAGVWRSEYDRWVEMLAGMYRGPGKDIVAWNSAQLYDMIFNQPVVYELGLLKMPVLLMTGDRDTTAIGKDMAPPEVRARIGNYPELARTVSAAIACVTLVEFPDLGHAPQIQDPVSFHKALLNGLAPSCPAP